MVVWNFTIIVVNIFIDKPKTTEEKLLFRDFTYLVYSVTSSAQIYMVG